MLPVFKEFSGIPAGMTEQSVAIAPRSNPGFTGWLARLLPPALARDDRAFFRDLTVPGAALFGMMLIAYALTNDWSGAIPRDGTTLAVGRLQLVFGTYHLPGPALIAPVLVACLVTRLLPLARTEPESRPKPKPSQGLSQGLSLTQV
jgi:hypothetical protein